MKQHTMLNMGQKIELSDVYYFKSKDANEKRRNKFVLFLIFIMFMLLSTGVSYTYWDGNINPINSSELNIGVGTTLLVFKNISPDNGTTLVPEGVFMGETDVDEMLFSFIATINKAGVLNIIVKDVFINESLDIYNSLTFDIYFAEPNVINQTNSSIILDTKNVDKKYTTEVFVKVSLNMPENEEQYNFVKNASISFYLEFKATKIE